MRKIGEMTEREKKVLQLREGGMTFSEVALAVGVSSKHALELFNNAKTAQWMRKHKREYVGLSVRAAKILSSEGIDSKYAARKAVEARTITYGSIRGMGVSTLEEIVKWCRANMPPPPPRDPYHFEVFEEMFSHGLKGFKTTFKIAARFLYLGKREYDLFHDSSHSKLNPNLNRIRLTDRTYTYDGVTIVPVKHEAFFRFGP